MISPQIISKVTSKLAWLLAPMQRVFLCMGMLIVLCSVVLTSCASKTPYEVLEESVIAEMNAYKYADGALVDRFIEYMDIAELSQFDINPQDFTKSFFADFDYTIDSIKVTEDAAQVQITLISKDYAHFEELLQIRIAEMEDRNSKKSIPQDRYKQMYGSAVMDCMNANETISRSTIEIHYLKDNNVWRPATEIFYIVTNALIPVEGE